MITYVDAGTDADADDDADAGDHSDADADATDVASYLHELETWAVHANNKQLHALTYYSVRMCMLHFMVYWRP